MVVGVAKISIAIYEADSLKSKRRVVRAIIDRIRSQRKVSIAEVGANDIVKRAELGIALVSNDAALANSRIDALIDQIDKLGVITSTSIEIIPMKMEN